MTAEGVLSKFQRKADIFISNVVNRVATLTSPEPLLGTVIYGRLPSCCLFPTVQIIGPDLLPICKPRFALSPSIFLLEEGREVTRYQSYTCRELNVSPPPMSWLVKVF
jgi:hypothetical protein